MKEIYVRLENKNIYFYGLLFPIDIGLFNKFCQEATQGQEAWIQGLTKGEKRKLFVSPFKVMRGNKIIAHGTIYLVQGMYKCVYTKRLRPVIA